jgi:hypothetical protein
MGAGGAVSDWLCAGPRRAIPSGVRALRVLHEHGHRAGGFSAVASDRANHYSSIIRIQAMVLTQPAWRSMHGYESSMDRGGMMLRFLGLSSSQGPVALQPRSARQPEAMLVLVQNFPRRTVAPCAFQPEPRGKMRGEHGN